MMRPHQPNPGGVLFFGNLKRVMRSASLMHHDSVYYFHVPPALYTLIHASSYDHSCLAYVIHLCCFSLFRPYLGVYQFFLQYCREPYGGSSRIHVKPPKKAEWIFIIGWCEAYLTCVNLTVMRLYSWSTERVGQPTLLAGLSVVPKV
jgi:hypothetical protein